ncbi:MAG TPA: Flp pilus assembly protein CpaB [Blastococcus sp.]|nr:Flp pilus assembly protein CpaB [Blastococcus sp.]
MLPRLRRPRFLLLTARRVAAGLLAVAALLLALRPEPAPARTVPPDLVPVAVAAADLPPGTRLGAGDLTLLRFPPALAPAGVVAEPDRLVGRVLAGGVRAREPLTDARLVGAGLTASLPRGQVAAPVRPADLAVAALVRTGDRVDVLAALPDGAPADVVAAGALVLAAPGPGTDQPDGLLLLAVDQATAARLAAASATATLTVTLAPP